MSGEAITVWGAAKTLESAGPAITNLSLAPAAAQYSVEVDGSSYPDGDIALTVTYATAPSSLPTLLLYARPMDIDGTLDSEAPEAGLPRVFIGYFQLKIMAGTQTVALGPTGFARDLPRRAEYWLYNNSTGQTIQAGWTLKITPRTTKPAP